MKKWIRRLQWTRIAAWIFLAAAGLFFPATQAKADDTGSISITQQVTGTGEAVEGVKLSLYKIANYSVETDTYTVESTYASLAIDPTTLGETETANAVVTKLDAYIDSTGAAALETKVTDASGQVAFTGLSDGIYFVKQTNTEDDFEALGYTYTTASYLIGLPRTTDDGTALTRNVSCVPKGTLTVKTETTDVVVYKEWKDNSDKAGKRPASIQVGLYNGSTLVDTITLNAANNWRGEWKELDASVSWTVQEIEVPAGYTASVTREENSFTITNTLTPSKTTTVTKTKTTSSSTGKVKTGDETSVCGFGITLLAAAAVLIVMLAKRQTGKNRKACEGK